VTLMDLILLCLLTIATAWLFCKLSAMLDACERPTDKKIEEMLKRAEEEVNNRPRLRAITKPN